MPAPVPVLAAGEKAWRRFVEFFTAAIANDNTREAYARDLSLFFEWCEEKGITSFGQVSPLVIATYQRALPSFAVPDHMRAAGRQRSKATVRRHLSALSEMFKHMAAAGVIDTNPTSAVKRPTIRRQTGTTPHLEPEDAKQLIDSIGTAKLSGLRDRALITTMILSWARIDAAVTMRVRDYRAGPGRRMEFRLAEKGGNELLVPAHHKAAELLDEWIAAAGIGDETDTPLFRSFDTRTKRVSPRPLSGRNALHMVKRRARAAGLANWSRICNHSFRASGITNYLSNGGSLEYAQRQAGHADPRTTMIYDRRAHRPSLDEVERMTILS